MEPEVEKGRVGKLKFGLGDRCLPDMGYRQVADETPLGLAEKVGEYVKGRSDGSGSACPP